MKSFWILCLVLFVKLVSGEEEEEEPSDDDDIADPTCLRYTWVHPENSVESNIRLNCSGYKGPAPCIEPLFATLEPLDMEDLLEFNNISSITCTLTPGYFCIKYSFEYNNAPVNVSRFCGKLIGEEMSVSSGCFTQYANKHKIEACACRSAPGATPCNGAMVTTLSVALTHIVILISLINMFIS